MQVSDSFGVTPQCLARLGLDPYDVVILMSDDLSSWQTAHGSSFSFRAVGRVLPHDFQNRHHNHEIVVSMTMFDFLHEAAAAAGTTLTTTRALDAQPQADLFRLVPSYRIRLEKEEAQQEGASCRAVMWKMQKVTSMFTVGEEEEEGYDEKEDVQIYLHCLYTEEDKDGDSVKIIPQQEKEHIKGESLSKFLATELADRLVAPCSITVLERHGKCTIVEVKSILYKGQEISDPLTAVRLPFDGAYIRVIVTLPDNKENHDTALNVSSTTYETAISCPGYTYLKKMCSNLLFLPRSARPSGLLLTGCAGVGKTRLATAIVSMSTHHWIRLPDCLWQALGKTAEELVAIMLPPHQVASLQKRHGGSGVLVVDDVHILAGADENPNDTEKRVLLAALVKVINQCTQSDIPVLAIASVSSSSELPPDLIKAGRLEKEIHMEAPTLMQREEILEVLLREMGHTRESQAKQWASVLASTTAGCVAADLRQL